MKIKDLLKKIASEETLTDEEKAFVAEYDPQKDADSAAAAARKEADGKLTKLQTQLDGLNKLKADMEAKLKDKDNAGKTELEKAQSQIADLSKQITGLTDKFKSVEQKKAALIRKQQVNAIQRKAGIQFVEGLDHGMLEASFSRAFDGLDELDNEDVVKVKVDTWKAMNKAAILDTSGSGTGNPPHHGGKETIARGLDGKDVDDMTPLEREKDLAKRGLLE